MNWKTIFVGCTISVVALSPVFAQQEKDTVRVKKDPKPKEVSILEENYKGVTYSLGAGGKTVLLWKEIESIDYSSRPKELTQAIAQIKRGDSQEALAALRNFKSQQSLRPIYRQQALFYLAQAAETSNPPHLDEAITNYRDLLKEFKQSRFLGKANAGIVTCLIATKKYDEATKAIEAARQEATAAKLDDELLRELDLLGCGLLENQGKFVEAANAYDKLAAAVTTANSDLATLAKIGSARCLVKKGDDPSKARAVFTDAIQKADENSSPVVLAAAWNGLGEIQLAEGRKEKKVDKIQEALYSFLRGVVLYFPGENDRTSEFERSLYYTSEAFRSLAEQSKEEEQKKLYQQRASEKLKDLESRFPLSSFLKK